MMRKILLLALVAAAAFAVGPADAKMISGKRFTYKLSEAPVACSGVCPYWQSQKNHVNSAGFGAFLHEVSGKTVPGVIEDHDFAQYACSNPGNADFYADRVVKAPTGARWLQFTVWPQVDWDSFVCLRTSTKTPNAKFLHSGANSVGDDNACGYPEGLAACRETSMVRVTAGKYYILRVFNWSDNFNLPAEYRFLT